MKTATCPRCSSARLIALPDGTYRCTNCQYVGSLSMDKTIYKK